MKETTHDELEQNDRYGDISCVVLQYSSYETQAHANATVMRMQAHKRGGREQSVMMTCRSCRSWPGEAGMLRQIPNQASLSPIVE